MKMDFSSELIDFFLDVEAVNNSDDLNDKSFVKQEFSFSTSEFSLEICLKYENSFNKDKIYKDINEVLTFSEHPFNQEIIESIIILFSLSKKKMRSASLIGTFFSFIKNCKLKQYLFFNGEQAEKINALKFHDFHIGNIDYPKFYDFIKNHSTSDFADKFKSSLSNKAGIEIKNFEVNMIDIYQWGSTINNGNLDLKWQQKEIFNLYLEALSRFYLNEFKRKFYKQQEFINSYFGLYYSLEEFEFLGYMFVNVFYNFLNNTKMGWVLPITVGLSEFYFPDPRIVEKVNSFLSTNGNIIYQAQGEFSRYFDSVTNIFSNAETHIARKNYNNAFVDFFVGLDFLLAPDTEKSKKLKQRISLLVYNRMSLTFAEQLARLDWIFRAT